MHSVWELFLFQDHRHKSNFQCNKEECEFNEIDIYCVLAPYYNFVHQDDKIMIFTKDDEAEQKRQAFIDMLHEDYPDGIPDHVMDVVNDQHPKD